MRTITHAHDTKCEFCDVPAVYSIGTCPICLMHFSILRNEMMGLVLKEHAFLMRDKNV